MADQTATTPVEPSPESPGVVQAASPALGSHLTLAEDLQALRALADRGPITFGDLVDSLQDRAGTSLLVILAFAFMLVPVPGVSTAASVVFFALAYTAVFATKPYLPGWVRKRSISQANAVKMLSVAAKGWTKISKLVKPRLGFLVSYPMRLLAGVSLFFAIVAFALPIPIPFNNSPPSFCILLLALGLLGRDGLLMLLGHVANLVMWLVLFLAGNFLWDLLGQVWEKVAG
jgi:hypothetical protein